MNIEDILEINLLKDLKYKYSSISEEQTLFLFFLRSFIYFNKTNLTTENYMNFLLLELNLPKDLYFNNIKINLYQHGNNNLFNIIDNFCFKCLDSYHNDLLKGNILGIDLLLFYFNKYKNEANKKFKAKKKIVNYKFVYKYFLLNCTYIDFNYKINNNIYYDNFNYPENYILSESFDFIWKKYYDEYINNNNKLLEKDLENYICKNGIDDIKIINHQIKINSGIIDLLGEDSNKQKVLIELKVVNRPKDLIWQLNSYTSDLKNIYPNIRTIVIAPKLNENIFNQLPPFVEVYEFTKNKTFKFKKIK